MSSLARLAAGVGRAAVAGFGLSAGRAAWKTGAKNRNVIWPLLLVLAVVAAAVTLPFIGGRELVKGHRRGFLLTVFVTWLGSALLVAAGYGAGLVADVWIQQFQGGRTDVFALRYLIVAAVVVTLTFMGMLVGAAQRGDRLRQFASEMANEAFLRTNGIRETSEKGATHIDADGNLLRYEGLADGRMTFFAVGRRNRRAYISIDADGAMAEYSGIVATGSR